MSYKIISKKMYSCICERCGWNWITDKLPKSCSKCKNKYWNKIKRKLGFK